MHMRSVALRCLISSVTAATLACVVGAASAQLAISKFTVDGGGGGSAGGAFAVGGTIGQPDAGRSSGASYTLSGGFWSGGGVVTGVEDGGPDGGIGQPEVAQLSFQMYPASPNPVAEQMMIAFDLPEPSLVRAALYDASGRLVRMLADGPLLAGKHQRAWDRRDQLGARVPSGIYFVRLDAGVHRSRQKIVVVS